MKHNSFTRFEDTILAKHINSYGIPDIKAIEEELQQEGYERAHGTIIARLIRLHEHGKIPKLRLTNGKPVLCLETDRHYASITDAARAVNLKNGNTITLACKDIQKTAANYHWRFI